MSHADDLHRDILNLQPSPMPPFYHSTSASWHARGHDEARNAAAELARERVAQLEARLAAALAVVEAARAFHNTFGYTETGAVDELHALIAALADYDATGGTTE